MESPFKQTRGAARAASPPGTKAAETLFQSTPPLLYGGERDSEA